VRLHLGEQAPLTMEDGRGPVIVVVRAIQPQDDWTPFLPLVQENERIRLEPMEGRALRCRVDRPP
jgi:hypothetical protein